MSTKVSISAATENVKVMLQALAENGHTIRRIYVPLWSSLSKVIRDMFPSAKVLIDYNES